MTQNIIRAFVALGAVAALFVAGLALIGGQQQFGGAGAYEALPTQFGNGLYAGLSRQLTIDSAGNIALANSSATSTLSGVGCIGAFATSSATPVKLVLSTLGATSTFKGTAYWSYGTCP